MQLVPPAALTTMVRKHQAPYGALRLSPSSWCNTCPLSVRKHQAPYGALRLEHCHEQKLNVTTVRKHQAP